MLITSYIVVLYLVALSAASVDLSKRKGGGGGHGGGGHSGSGKSSGSKGSRGAKSRTHSKPHGAIGAGSQGYLSDECYDQSLNPLTYYGDSDRQWVQVNQTSVSWKGTNEGQNPLSKAHPNTNWYFDIYDAYYNGTFQVTLEPSANETSCGTIKGPPISNAYFRIGQTSRPGGRYSRKNYDKNQYYFRFGRSTTVPDFKCYYTPYKIFTSFESSNNLLQNPMVWSLDAEREGDHFNISGKVTTDYANYNNYFNYLAPGSANASCPSHFQQFTLRAKNNVTMTGTVSATSAQLSWAFVDPQNDWKVIGNFTGSWWDRGAKLDLSGSQPQTLGEAVRVGAVEEVETWWDKHGKVVIIVVSVVGFLILAAIGGLVAWCVIKRKKSKKYEPARQADNDNDWTVDDDRKESMTAMRSLAPSPAPSTQRLLAHEDTAYHGLTGQVSAGLAPPEKQNETHRGGDIGMTGQ